MIDLLTGLKNKKGSFAVFAVMAFTAMLIILWAAIESSSHMAISSATNSFGDVWGKSILGEYDIMLKEKYGIFAFAGNDFDICKRLNAYAKYSFDNKDYITYQGADCNLADYSLDNVENFKSQINDIVLSRYKPPQREADISDVAPVNREIKSQWIIKGLPSYNTEDSINLLTLVSEIKNGMNLKNLLGRFSMDNYIFTFFKSSTEDNNLGDTYFQNEIEYIISGKLSDEESVKSTGTKIKVLRNLLNLYYLYTDKEKREATFVLASAITPGPLAYVTQGAMMETWALAEANNDLKILHDNKTVPLIKKKSNWALSFENVFNANAESLEDLEKSTDGDSSDKNYVSPQQIEGEDYTKYLGILLSSMREEVKLLRMMDLIQINMKYLYCDYFLIKDYYVGLNYTLKVNGKIYEFDESYKKSK